VKELVLEVVGTDEHTALCGDEALRKAMVQTLEENATPCWTEGDYWQRLIAKLAALPRNGIDDGLRAAHTLITWNFNSDHFVEYMLLRYELALAEEIHPRQQWQENRLALVRVIETQRYALYPALPSCRSLLLARIDEEISASEFKDHVMRNQPSIALSLSVAQIGALLRIICDTNFIETTNITAMLTQAASMFTSKRGGQISAHSLRQKFYYPESAALSIVETHLSRLLKECKKQLNGSLPAQ
jgi:hypothetical protein